MLELLKKDLRISLSGYKGKSLLIIFVLYYICMKSIGDYYLFGILAPFLSYIFIMQTFSKTEKNNSNKHLLAMPIKREDVVFSKYILSFLSILIISFIILVLNKIKLFGILSLSMQDIYINIVSFLLSMSIILPLIFKLGYKITKYLAAIISIIIFRYISATSSLSAFLYNNEENFIINICKIIVNLINNIQKNRLFDPVKKTTEVYLILIPIIVFIVFIVSMGISIAVYKNKDID